MTHRITNRLKSNYDQSNLVQFEAWETMIITAEVDLIHYKDIIRSNDGLFVSVQYGWLQWHDSDNAPRLIYSNKIYLE